MSFTFAERSSHPSRAQIDALIEFLEENPRLAKGLSKVPNARDGIRKKWEKFTVRLNSLGGSIKTWKQWTKYWADKKSTVLKKAAMRCKGNEGFGEAKVELSEVEERILSLMGGIDRQPILPSTNERTLPLHTQDTHNIDTPAKENTNDVLQEIYVAVSVPPAEANENHQHTTSEEFKLPVPPTQSPRPQPRRRRFLQAPSISPPSLTERLLIVEEQRLELDHQNTEVSKKMAGLMAELLKRERDRDKQVAQGLLAIGEGLKLLAEALNNRK